MEQEVLDALEKHDGAMSTDEIVMAIFDGDKRCHECGKTTNAYTRAWENVTETLLTLRDKNKIVQNAQWKYRLTVE